RRHEAAECLLELPRVEQAKNSTECVVAGNAVFEPQEAPQQKFLGTAKVRHVRRTLGPAQHGSKGDKQEFHQIVAGVVRPRIGQTSENLLEFAHVTPLEKWESPSESTFAADAIPVPNPYAIPLPCGGGISFGGAFVYERGCGLVITLLARQQRLQADDVVVV